MRTASVALLVWLSACGGGGGETFHCVTSSGSSTSLCYAYTHLTSAVKDAESSSCVGMQGMIVDACPTASIVGCCTFGSTDVDTEVCYYSGTASDLEAQCKSSHDGSWATKP